MRHAFLPHSIDRQVPYSRRDVLQLAASLGLSFAVPGLSSRAAEQRGPERKKSFLQIWLAGGPSQLETWDPHPSTEIGGPTTAIDTRISGVQIGSSYPLLAEQIHRLSIIRSMISKEGDHERGAYLMRTGFRPDPTTIHPAIGAIASFVNPPEGLEIPAFITLADRQFPPRGGYLGDRFDPFHVYEPGQKGANISSGVEGDRQTNRLEGLKVVSGSFARGRARRVEETLHEHTMEAALKMMTSKQLAAFQIDTEPKELQAAYGANQFGQACLVARRLIEHGVRAVEICLSGFDSHANNFETHKARAEVLDPGLATLLKDMADRDLLDSTVVLVAGEFGRTPKINPVEGRDHWPSGFSCLIGGGGMNSGMVIGATDPHGVSKDPTDPVEVKQLFATVLRGLGIDYQKEMLTPIGRPLAFADTGAKHLEKLFAPT